MDIRTLTGEFSVSPQLTLANIHAVAEAGYRTIVCNRPDDEAPTSPALPRLSAALRSWACRLATCRPSPVRSATSRSRPSQG